MNINLSRQFGFKWTVILNSPFSLKPDPDLFSTWTRKGGILSNLPSQFILWGFIQSFKPSHIVPIVRYTITVH